MPLPHYEVETLFVGLDKILRGNLGGRILKQVELIHYIILHLLLLSHPDVQGYAQHRFHAPVPRINCMKDVIKSL